MILILIVIFVYGKSPSACAALSHGAPARPHRSPEPSAPAAPRRLSPPPPCTAGSPLSTAAARRRRARRAAPPAQRPGASLRLATPTLMLQLCTRTPPQAHNAHDAAWCASAACGAMEAASRPGEVVRAARPRTSESAAATGSPCAALAPARSQSEHLAGSGGAPARARRRPRRSARARPPPARRPRSGSARPPRPSARR